MNDPRFNHLFQPIKIGRMELKNRIVMPSMLTCCASRGGKVTSRLKNYYEARAKGGVGLIILGAAYVHLRGRRRPLQLAIVNDHVIPTLRELVECLHKHGVKVAAQFFHAGFLSPENPIAPSIGGKLIQYE